MKPSIRLLIGKSPFRIGINLPIEDIIGTVVSTLFNLAQEPEQQIKSLTSGKQLHVLVHDNGEIEIPASTEEEAIDAAKKAMKLIELKNPKLYRVVGDQRVLVAN